jgi:hypothetical protein
MSSEKTITKHILGLDLGKRQDPSSLVTVEHQRTIETSANYRHTGQRRQLEVGSPVSEEVKRSAFSVVRIDRFPLGTEYRDVARTTRRVMESPKTKAPTLVLDANGVGDAVTEILKDAGVNPVQIYTTGGREANREGGSWSVPKGEVVSTLQVLLQDGRLDITEGLDLADQLITEMRAFSVRYTDAGNVRFEHSGDGHHGDTVIALALACWYGESAATQKPSVVVSSHHSGRNSARSIRERRQYLIRNR